LNPSPQANSIAYAIAGNQQAGTVYLPTGPHAAIWSGAAASFLDLNPPGARTSEILATTGTQQAGFAAMAGAAHAGIWSGTADSFVDLHPAGATDSKAHATTGAYQAGIAWYEDPVSWRVKHAMLWFGSADNYFNLHPVLGTGFYESEASSLWTDGTTILVAGHARTQEGYARPILWTITVPEPGIGAFLVTAAGLWAFAKARNGKRN
jgi:hypothetical protein